MDHQSLSKGRTEQIIICSQNSCVHVSKQVTGVGPGMSSRECGEVHMQFKSHIMRVLSFFLYNNAIYDIQLGIIPTQGKIDNHDDIDDN
jgi:hypothetical protein